MLDNLILTAGSIGVEFFGNPGRFFGSLVAAGALAIACMWACWRVGRLFSMAYRPGFGNFMLALVAAFCVFAGVVGFAAVSYSRSLVSSAFEVGQTGAKTLNGHAPGACRAMRASLPYLAEQTGKNLTLNCDSPVALEQLRVELGAKIGQVQAGLQDRFRWNQFLNVVGALVPLGICLCIPSWHASRSLVLHVGKYRRS